MKWSDPFLHVRARLMLKIHRRFFNKRHFWVTAHRDHIMKGAPWCFECGTLKFHTYKCKTEHRLRRSCEPAGDYPNCIEVVEALLFVRHPDVDKATLCDWCEDQARKKLWGHEEV